MDITVVGAGYVGLVTGACLAYLGHAVHCVDTDAGKIALLERGEPPFHEPHLQELLHAAAQRGGMRFSGNTRAAAASSEVIFIAVGTPPLASGAADLTALGAAAHEIGSAIDAARFRVVVNKSTVPVGSGNLVDALVRESYGRTNGFGVASNPEFLREGSAVADSLYPDRIVVGADSQRVVEVMHRLYRPIAEQSFEAPAFLPRPEGRGRVPLIVTSTAAAEMIKYAANAFLATKISFANEIANICEKVGADVVEVMSAVGLDGRIGGAFLNAGIGWGGSCFHKDVRALAYTASEYGYVPRLLEACLAVNRAQRRVVIQKLQEKLFTLKGRLIGILGLAFKPETDDLRDAPSLEIIERLLEMGARVKTYDPVAMPACREQHPALRIGYCGSPYQAAEAADALVLVTEWEEFRGLDLDAVAAAMARPVLIDGRNAIDPAAARRAGFDYSAIGRPGLSSARRVAP